MKRLHGSTPTGTSSGNGRYVSPLIWPFFDSVFLTIEKKQNSVDRRGSYNTSSNSAAPYASSYNASLCMSRRSRYCCCFNALNFMWWQFRRNVAIVCRPRADENGRIIGAFDRCGSRTRQCRHCVRLCCGVLFFRAMCHTNDNNDRYGEPGTPLQATPLLEAIAALSLKGEVLRHWLRDGQHFCFVEVIVAIVLFNACACVDCNVVV
jgi:hypothetical protein